MTTKNLLSAFKFFSGVTPEALEKSIKLGAVSFLPKEKMTDLDEFIADVVLKEGQPVWEKLFDKLGSFFNKRFGPDWKKRNQFFEEFEQSIQQSKQGGELKIED